MITIQPGFYLHVCIASALEAYPRLFQDHSKVNYRKNKMKPTNPNAHTYVNGTDVKTHGYAVTHNTFL